MLKLKDKVKHKTNIKLNNGVVRCVSPDNGKIIVSFVFGDRCYIDYFDENDLEILEKEDK